MQGNKRFLLSAMCYLIFLYAGYGQPSTRDVQDVLTQINALRSTGCKCGNEWMQPVSPLSWDDTLYRSAREYAQYMNRNDFFDHVDHYGRDLGDRLDRLEYKWLVFGENLGRGYMRFYEVFNAWKESTSHCKMLMNDQVTHMAISRQKKYWALSLALPMPEPMASDE